MLITGRLRSLPLIISSRVAFNAIINNANAMLTTATERAAMSLFFLTPRYIIPRVPSRIFENAPAMICSSHLVELMDGGTGEELMKRGLPDDRKTWSAKALTSETYHDLVVDVHKSFIKAGSKYITCNNYGVTPGVGFSEKEIASLTCIAGQLASRAREEEATGRDVFICGSLPPLVESYRPDLALPEEEACKYYAIIRNSLEQYVDIWLAETLSSSSEVIAALKSLRKTSKPVFVSMTLNSRGFVRSEESVSSAVTAIIDASKNLSLPIPKAVLFNCCEPEAITKALDELRGIKDTLDRESIRLGAYANRLTPIQADWELSVDTPPQATRHEITPQIYFHFVEEWISRYGVTLIGGCCGIDPCFIEYIRNNLKL